MRHPRTYQYLSVLIVLLAAHVGSALAQADSPAEVEMRLLTDIKFLAGDAIEGRGVGTEGLNKAADYIREVFTQSGLDVTADAGDPFQDFEITKGSELIGTPELSLVGPGGETLTLKPGEDFNACSFGGSGAFDAPLVFVGYGIESEKNPAYNDFAGIDIKGKVALIMRRAPQQNDPHSPFGNPQLAAVRNKVGNAFRLGAVAVLIVNDTFTAKHDKAQLEERFKEAQTRVITAAEAAVVDGADAEKTRAKLAEEVKHYQQVQKLHAEEVKPDPLMEFGYGGNRTGESAPAAHITQTLADKLLATSGQSLAALEKTIDETAQPASMQVAGWTAKGKIELRQVKVPVKNVIAVLPAAEGPLKDQTIVVGAHYDHLGSGGDGSLLPGSTEIHNGADDNASGTTGLLELARRLGQRKGAFSRRIVFIGFTGEERGLLGSQEYCKNPLFPLDQTVAMFNMDMIGRLTDEKLTVFGVGTSPVWDPLLDRLAPPYNFVISRKPEGFGPSDHSSFYGKDIPVLHMFTGIHPDYHRPTDDWEKVNINGIDRIVNLLELLITETANAENRPAYVKIAGSAQIERSGNRPYFGSIPDFNSEAKGYALSGVAPESPAALGGLLGGDVVTAIGPHKISNLDDFDLVLRKFSAGEEVEVTVQRQEAEVKVKVTLGKPK